MDKKKLGSLGERAAEKFLKQKGYLILDRNYSFRIPGSPQKGEIDIVAKNEGVITFIEVKTLTSEYHTFLPEDKVDFKKQRKIIKAAESWLIKKRIPPETPWQVDVVSVRVANNLKKAKIQHFRNVISG